MKIKEFTEKYNTIATDRLKEDYLNDNLHIKTYLPFLTKVTLAEKPTKVINLNIFKRRKTMLKKYITYKKNEWKVKAMLYGTIVQIMDNQDEIKDMLDLVKRLYEELKDVPTEDLQKEFVSKLAEIIHNEQLADNK